MRALGVVLPTRNSMAYLPAHLAGMAEWLDFAEEVVVVDSVSKDGTLDYIKANLSSSQSASVVPSRPVFINPGTTACKISRRNMRIFLLLVIIPITRDGLGPAFENRWRASSRCGCQSKPRFVAPDGSAVDEPFWPIDDVFKHFPDAQLKLLEGIGLYFFALMNYSTAMLEKFSEQFISHGMPGSSGLFPPIMALRATARGCWPMRRTFASVSRAKFFQRFLSIPRRIPSRNMPLPRYRTNCSRRLARLSGVARSCRRCKKISRA